MKQEKGVLALFDDPHQLLEAVKRIRASKFSKIEAFTPFPVHGLEHALGLSRSFIPYITFVMGLVGLCCGLGLQYWTSAVDWPINVGGKPFFSWQAFVPITFETTILIGGVTTVLSLFGIIRLPNFSKKVLDTRLTNDHFGLFIDESDPFYDAVKIQSLLTPCHLKELKRID